MIHLLVWSLLHIEFESFLEEEKDERNTSQKFIPPVEFTKDGKNQL